MKRNGRQVKKLILAVMVVVMLPVLCSCRTRLTNNTEVIPTVSDNDGYLTEDYEMRRDEINKPIAVPPILKGSGPDEEYYEDDYYGDADMLSDYDYDAQEEDNTDETSTTNNNSPRPTTPSRPAARPTTPPVSNAVRVTFDSNGGFIEVNGNKVEKAVGSFAKGKTYGELPKPAREGYEFTGWYADKKGGKAVTGDTKVPDKDHTLYAQWKKAEEEKPEKKPEKEPEKEPEAKEYTVTFDINAGGDDAEFTSGSETMTVKEGGNYGSLPTVRRGSYTFAGWYTAPEGGDRVSGDDAFKANSDQTLYAHWDYDAYTSWDNSFQKAANDITEDNRIIYINKPDKSEKSLLEECRSNVAGDGEEAEYILEFEKNFDYPDNQEAWDEKALALLNDYLAAHPDSESSPMVILMTDDALKGDKNQKLIYRMSLLGALYGSYGEEDIAKAAEELGVEYIAPYVY